MATIKNYTLNKTATDIMLLVLAELGEQNHIKINNNKEGSGIMPLSVERRAANLAHPSYPEWDCSVYSLAHYYEQNGDLMADPLMEFIVIDGRSKKPDYLDRGLTEKQLDLIQWVYVQPCMFQQD